MNNRVMIQLLLILLFVVMVAFFLLYKIMSKKLAKKLAEDNLYIAGKKSKNYWYLCYQYFSQMTFTKRYVAKIRSQYDLLYPGDIKKINITTIKVCFSIWGLSLVAVIILLFFHPSLYYAIVTMTAIYVLSHQVLYMKVNQDEMKLLKQFDRFLSNVRHYYYMHGMVDEAIYETLDISEYEIGLHISKIYNVLTSHDLEDEINDYNDTAPNRFFSMFLALSATVLEYGDKKVDGHYQFMHNIKDLKHELNIEYLKKQKINSMFSGLIFIAVLPIFFLEAIKKWGISNIQELEAYYNGSWGIITAIGIFVITLFAYNMVNYLKDNFQVMVKDYIILKKILTVKPIKNIVKIYINKNYGKVLVIRDLLKRVGDNITDQEFVLKRFLYCIGTFFVCIVISLVLHSSNRKQLLVSTNDITLFSSSASDKEINEVKNAIIVYTEKFRSTDHIDLKTIEHDLVATSTIKNKEIMTLAAKEILRRVIKYNNEYYKWYELLVACIVACIAYHCPKLLLLYKKRVMQMTMEDEVIQFQSIILMLMYIDRMTIENILEWMEKFAVIFRQSIQICINDFDAGDIAALEKLQEEEPFEPFARLVSNLIMADQIGIEQAFDEIAIDRSNFQEKRKQENEIYTRKKATMALFISYAPLSVTLFLYLIVPFIVESFSQLTGSLSQFKTFN